MILSKFFKNHLTIPQAINLFEEIKSQTHPDIADLKRLVNFHKAPIGTKDELQALDLKYRAITHVPTTIEKTMTRSQLYLTNNPLWTNNMRPKDIIEIIAAVPWLKNYGTENQITNMFDKIIDFNGNVNYLKLNKLYQ